MIEKMSFLNISGPKADIDRVALQYLSKYEIELENALSELKTEENLTPYVQANPYKDTLTMVSKMRRYLDSSVEFPDNGHCPDDPDDFIHNLYHKFMEIQDQRTTLKTQREDLREKLKVIEPFRPLDFDIGSVLHYQFIKFRFGRISKDYYHKLEKYVYEDLDAIFLRGGEDASYVYGVYFVSLPLVDKIDTIFTSLHFERVFIPADFTGKPSESCAALEQQIEDITTEINDLRQKMVTMITDNGEDLLNACRYIKTRSDNFDIRKLAACTDEKHQSFYILCGWMSSRDTADFQKEVENDPNVFVVVDDDRTKFFSSPPVKLKNPKLIRPFELFVRMYGLPSPSEIDPTPFIAITYTFIFGVMFGDVGQGIFLILVGLLIYKKKKADLAAIISMAGVFSTIFGFMFGSFFGFENVIQPVWLRPIKAMTTLPFIGKLNTIFIVTIAFGMFLIILSMILHIINGIRAKDPGETWFDANGLAGLIFYGGVVMVLVLYMSGKTLPGTIVLLVMFIVPLVLIALKEPLTYALEHRKNPNPTSVGMFITEAFFELFEMLLSYFSNTLSFVRIGAFAVSHAAMMEVVLMLAGAEAGTPNWVGVVLGNLFVIGMEGLIVGIQVLRLEYYEMFSRFYKGGGREFKPFIRHTGK